MRRGVAVGERSQHGQRRRVVDRGREARRPLAICGKSATSGTPSGMASQTTARQRRHSSSLRWSTSAMAPMPAMQSDSRRCRARAGRGRSRRGPRREERRGWKHPQPGSQPSPGEPNNRDRRASFANPLDICMSEMLHAHITCNMHDFSSSWTLPAAWRTRPTSDCDTAIRSGMFAPRERLSAEALSKELGVSRMPVVQALRRLASEGFVTVEAHKPVRVADPRPPRSGSATS